MRLNDTNIIVTGASSGLGKAMATAFVEEGALVVCSSYEDDRLSTTVSDLSDSDSGDAIGVSADVRSWSDCNELVRDAREWFGDIDVLVNNAGITQLHANEDHERRRVVDVPVSAWDDIIKTNLRGPFLCSKAVLPRMLDRGSGRLLHVSSGTGRRGKANRAPYAASKFGLEGFHESLALELAGTGVSSVAFRPPEGGVYSERYGDIGRTPESFGHEDPRILAETAVRLAGGEGENGGRYVATPDGRDYREYTRA